MVVVRIDGRVVHVFIALNLDEGKWS